MLAPLGIAIYPLVWLTAKARFNPHPWWGVLALAAAIIPRGGVVAGFALLLWLRRELARHGLALSWFTAAPAT